MAQVQSLAWEHATDTAKMEKTNKQTNKKPYREFPGGLVVRTQHFHHWGPSSIPGLGTEIPHWAAACCRPKRKMKKSIAVSWIVCFVSIFWYWIVWVLYIFWILTFIWYIICSIFSHLVCFLHLDGYLHCAKAFSFDTVPFIYFCFCFHCLRRHIQKNIAKTDLK